MAMSEGSGLMSDWNMLVSTYQGGYRRAVRALRKLGSIDSRISFSDPDPVIAIDTVDDCAGIALWTREGLARHRLLRPD